MSGLVGVIGCKIFNPKNLRAKSLDSIICDGEGEKSFLK
jgi:hypothetical protein